MEQPRTVIMDQRKELFLFRNGHGFHTELPGLKGVAGNTPPVPSGTTAAQFSQFSG